MDFVVKGFSFSVFLAVLGILLDAANGFIGSHNLEAAAYTMVVVGFALSVLTAFISTRTAGWRG